MSLKKKRKRIREASNNIKSKKIIPDNQEVKEKIAETLEQLTSKSKSKSAKIRRDEKDRRGKRRQLKTKLSLRKILQKFK